ncbi:DUF4249 domain-containing protein [Pedobacter sp. PLR]|uniref:DUF4249 domain-containing protein n=1 Tax=Pedobacter sp. PLR TaxID=2994465 RepID=UPI00224699CF|nr:DUF4249 domain-containing protein [Pedobacter sp. PLR]MCX2452124.1 DUF4249 domain-containing protein [Pedobacter sp. PLR]
MISFRNTLLFIGLMSLIYACKKEGNPGLYKPRFVVEGWIEQDDFPYVIVTHNLPFFTAVDSAQLAEVIIRYAKVTVSDGTETEVLTATTDKRYFPYFVYRGTSLKGKVGGKYSLKVEYAGNTLTSETEIPNPVNLDSIWFTEKQVNNRQLNVQIVDAANEKNYYRLYTKLEKEVIFTPTLLANQDDLFFNGKKLVMQVNRGMANNLTTKHDPYFNIGDTVLVKLSAIPASGYAFWNSLQDEILNGSNPLISSSKALKTNIKGPGVGVWCGYSSKIYRVIAK